MGYSVAKPSFEEFRLMAVEEAGREPGGESREAEEQQGNGC
jgi:hypothetical protein